MPARIGGRICGSCPRRCSLRESRTASTCRPAERASSCKIGRRTCSWTPSGSRAPRTSATWAWFLDRQGSEARPAPPRGVPEAASAGIAPEPWSSRLSPGEWFEANERAVVALCLLALSLTVVWQETRFWKTRHLKDTVAGELARMQDELGPLLDARNELLRLRRTNRALTDILGTPSQALLMGLVDRALPSTTAQFREWRYQQGELRVIVEDPDPDPIAYVPLPGGGAALRAGQGGAGPG